MRKALVIILGVPAVAGVGCAAYLYFQPTMRAARALTKIGYLRGVSSFALTLGDTQTRALNAAVLRYASDSGFKQTTVGELLAYGGFHESLQLMVRRGYMALPE